MLILTLLIQIFTANNSDMRNLPQMENNSFYLSCWVFDRLSEYVNDPKSVVSYSLLILVAKKLQ